MHIAINKLSEENLYGILNNYANFIQPDLQDVNGNSITHALVQFGSEDIITVYLKRFNKVNVNLLNKEGYTALHLSIKQNHRHSVI